MWLRLGFAIAVFSLTLDSTSVLAVPDSLLPLSIAQNEGRPNRPPRGMPRWIGELNLTPDQMQQMQAIRSRYQNQISQRAQALRQAESELQQLMASNADTNQIRTKHNQVQSLRQQLAQVRFESMLEMRQVLTPEQRRQLAQRMNQRRQNFPNRRIR